MDGQRMSSQASLPVSSPLFRERRQSIRHRIHSPAYASLNSSAERVLPDLHEIVDLSEGGMCFRHSSLAQVGEELDLRLDLSETKGSIHLQGHVVWSEPSGRTGVRFEQAPADFSSRLKEWLFANLLIAHANATGPASDRSVPAGTPDASAPESDESVGFHNDYTSVIAAVAAVNKEVERMEANGGPALQLLAERARTLTRATGAAIALADGEIMVCRAASGQDSPGVGARFSATEGFSGACVTMGQLLYCDDSETDLRVDRESCRALGIRAIVAVPVRSSGTVAGVLEIFSPQPDAFSEADRVAVQRMAEIVGRVAQQAGVVVAPVPVEPAATSAVETPEGASSSGWRRKSMLLTVVLAGIFVLSGLAWRYGKRVVSWKANSATPSAVKAAAPEATTLPAGIEGVQVLAERGDPTAQFAMGAHFATGQESTRDYAQAAHWFTLAAENGHVTAQSTLAAYYWAGTGVPKDLSKAYFWAILAQAGGDEAAKLRASVLASLLDRKEIVVEQRRANEWLAQHGITGSPASVQ